jgi:HSP20 family molecular chaperone IbpA
MNRKYYSDVFQVIDDIFSDMVTFSDHQPSRFNKSISSAAYPPANVLINPKTKELTIEVALVGCKESDLNLSFDSDYLKLVVDRSTGDPTLSENEEARDYVIQRGLKIVDRAEVSWLVDVRFYDRDSTKVNFENGLLTIKIQPKEDVAPKQISVFGKLNINKSEPDKPAIES